jgi:hypothetical protein
VQGTVGQVPGPPRKLQKSRHEFRACWQSIKLTQLPKGASSLSVHLATNMAPWHCGSVVVVVVGVVVVVVGAS